MPTPWTCRDPDGWGPLSSNRPRDLTPCFEDGVLGLGLQLGFALACVARLVALHGRPLLPTVLTHNWQYWTKQILYAVAIVASGVLIAGIAPQVDVSGLFYLSQVCTTVLAAVLHSYEHNRSMAVPKVLSLYWSLNIAVQSLRLRTWYLEGFDTYPLVAVLAQIIIVGASTVLALVEWLPRQPDGGYTSLDVTSDLDDFADSDLDCPVDRASLLSRVTFSWLSPLLALGYQKPLEQDDLWPLPHSLQTRHVANTFHERWTKERRTAKPSLFWVLATTFGAPFLLGGLIKLFNDLLMYVQPQLLSLLIKFVQTQKTDPANTATYGYMIPVTMLLVGLLQVVCLHQYFQLTAEVGIRIRTALVTAIYQKALWLANSTQQQFTVGEIVNRMSIDAQDISQMITYGHMVWSPIFQMGLALYFLHQTLGWSIFVGVGVMVLFMPANAYTMIKQRDIQRQEMKYKDARIKLMDEILNGIKVIKLYAWELPFMNKVRAIRDDLELTNLRRFSLLYAVQSLLMQALPSLVSLVTFAVYALVDGESHGPLTADLIFVSIALFNLLRFPLNFLPMILGFIVSSGVAFNRIYTFLLSGELDPTTVEQVDFIAPLANPLAKSQLDNTTAPCMVQLNGATMHWSLSPENRAAEPILSDITLECHRRELVAVIGRVGSGKSSLMSAILGDMEKSAGTIKLRGQVAYAPQQPWIMNATLRENILFGHRYDPHFYQQAIQACGLQQDFDMLPAGDLTEIGEKGINLSGGQKARVSLARAVYARADVYLLDDPLSAVDAHVGQHIVKHVLGPQGLLKGRARILVTHAIHVLDQANRIVMLRNGCIAEQGSFADLMAHRGEVFKLVGEFGDSASQTATPQSSSQSGSSTNLATGLITPAALPDTTKAPLLDEEFDWDPAVPRTLQALTDAGSLARGSLASSRELLHRRNETQQSQEGLMSTEGSQRGSVQWGVYKAYFKACSPPMMLLYLGGALLQCVVNAGTDFWLKVWSNANADAKEPVDNTYYLGVYAGLALFAAVCAAIAPLILWVFCAIRAAKQTHEALLYSVLRSPMSFFDTTPLGRILNRFSKDQTTLDQMLPRTLDHYVMTLIRLVMIVAVVLMSTPLISVLLIPLSVAFRYLQRYYLTSSLELKRLDSVSRSPIYAQFQETLGGASTIRAYRQTHRFARENEYRLDLNQQAYFPYISLNRWLAVRLETIGALMVFSVSLLAVFMCLHYGDVDTGLVGLAVSYSLTIAETLNWCVRQYCELENNIVSMERIQEYSQLPSEAPEVRADTRPSPSWPEKGTVEFTDYATRYRPELDLTLQDVGFTAQAGEKVGIVGRTGAGKSSLTLALFRIVEASRGRIIIDGVDIAKLGLYDLRSRLTIIPQDPVLFAGTVRENLDPLQAHDDQALWDALECVHLKVYVQAQADQLEHVVAQNGANFSVGQRQLICLARALLRRTKVLVLDEATAAIDVETDELIQQTIRHEFRDCTVLTIAHRINTVMDSDRILVMDQGQVAEFAPPQQLLANPDSLFYKLAKEAGQTS
ncbi:hypothetical protein H4R34_002105 [Dimargaris verticillata]|uniref:P-loop containing nucleoside triphosphate hydrolase protein n=1 Tax=Dimargaris verticillata TaxID=2761393 RepID=A0A9W8B756_9FUNG|nr:hypothetical protein H4R34_002105 [Dimargaris verticillata]